MDLEVSQLKDVFVDPENFEEEDDNDGLFENNEAEGAKFILAKETNTRDNEILICKVYNPDLLKVDQNEGSNDKKDQCWYHQLMLLREVIFLKELSHPTIVNFKGFNLYNRYIHFEQLDEDEEDAQDYSNPTVFLEFLQNKSLKNVIEDDVPYDIVKRQIGMIGVSSAVYYLHRKKILHRNLTPKTIWLDENMYPKVFDFSSSRENSANEDTQKTQISTGTLNYQSPEIFSNDKDYDFPVDVFSLGRLIYYFATGYEPFTMNGDPLKKENRYTLMNKIAHQEYPLLPKTIPNGLQELLKRCWSLNPGERPTAKEMYYTLIWDKKCQIVEFNKEILDYIDNIQKFEMNLRLSKLEINQTMEANVDIPLFDHSPSSNTTSQIPESANEQINLLINIITSNFAERNETNTLQLLNKMVENNTIFKENYLQKVLNYVNNLSSKGNNLADQFLNNAFGEYINIPRDKTEITKGLINSNISKANIPNWVKKIGKNAFSSFKNLEKVNIPNSVTEIDDEAFSECPKLTYINIPDSVTSLGSGAFKNCQQLRFIQLPNKLTKLKKATFKGDNGLSQIVLNKTLREVGAEAFYGCESLTYVEIPASVKILEPKAFHKCKNLTTMYFLGGSKRPKIEKKAVNWKVKQLP